MVVALTWVYADALGTIQQILQNYVRNLGTL